MEYISQATCGLNFLHQNNVVHRDFKPENLLVTGPLEEIKVVNCNTNNDHKQFKRDDTCLYSPRVA